MLKRVPVFIILLGTLFFSCKKSTDDPQPPSINTVKSLLTKGGGLWKADTSYVTYYDSHNNILKRTGEREMGSWKFKDSIVYFYWGDNNIDTLGNASYRVVANNGADYLYIYLTSYKIESINDTSISLSQTNMNVPFTDDNQQSATADHSKLILNFSKVQ